MVRAFALALMLAGCGRLFDLEPPAKMHDAATGDGSMTDVPSDVSLAGDAGSDGAQNAMCPSSYTAVSNSKYRLVTLNKSWDIAQATCLGDQVANSSMYTHLIVVASDNEMNALATFTSNDTWIGLSDRVTEGAYQWVTTETTTYPPATGAPWGLNEPQAGTNTNCVLIQGATNIKTQSCGNSRSYVCECDAFAADPTRY